jgi:hypothetical protein
VPFKAHAAGRHHIPKQRYRVTNWRAYDASLRQRGSLTVWFTEEAIAAWRAEPAAHDPGRAALVLAPLAILTALTRRTVFRLALPQTEGLVRLPSASSGNQLGMLLERPRMRALLRRAPR